MIRPAGSLALPPFNSAYSNDYRRRDLVDNGFSPPNDSASGRLGNSSMMVGSNVSDFVLRS